ncbi:MAG TPA: NACHT domain-containing protein [Anaerolineales bacterium]|nr:NACHT domain-containing protein [Anaerolineales bacterium]
MPTFLEFLDLLYQAFPKQAETIVVIVLVLVGVWWTLNILSKIKTLWTKELAPLFYNPEEKRRVARRRRFADHVESEIRRLNNLEAWSDYRFAELEAEVEAEGRQRIYSLLPFLQRSRSGLRRERSLSKALETSQERLILLEGEPGSGKSVALRHVTQSMARRAMKARSSKSTIPIYINLKELKPQKDEVIDRNLIQAFVLKSLNRANDRDIEEFLENEFDKGLQEGTWLFLFDSFDEIPDVLSSTEADAIIRSYSDAISDFLHGMNLCRGIVASRQFRGPGQSGWPRFRILQLSEARRTELVRKADLGAELQTTIVGQLGIAGDEIRGMVSNPMFLGLLCEYMRAGNSFPQNTHSVFETYVETRLTRDEERLQRRFKLKPNEIRATAENVAFCMASDSGLGLTPTRDDITTAMKHLGFPVSKKFISHLDALEYIKLARSETATAAGDSKPFTFSHRRFQEYFATCIVLREQKRVAPHILLTDARWRETTVVICQTQPANLLLPLIKEARSLLAKIKKEIPELIDDPIKYANESKTSVDETNKLSGLFPWPAGVLHLVGLLQDGFVSRLKDLPDDIRLDIGRILLTATENGALSDKKWALEIAGTIPSDVLLLLLRNAFASESQWLSEAAFRQTARLGKIPDDIARSVRQALVSLYVTRRLRQEKQATYAHLARLDKSEDFLDNLRLLSWITIFDMGIHLVFSTGLIIATIRAYFIAHSVPSFLSILFPSPTVLIITIIILSLLSTGSLRALSWLFMVFSLHIHKRTRIARSYIAYLMISMMGVYLRLLVIILTAQISLPLAFLFAWAPFAVLAVLTGRFTHPVWWLAMPIWPLLYLASNFTNFASQLWVWLQKNWKNVLVFPILAVPLTMVMTLYFLILAPILVLISPIIILTTPFFWLIDLVSWRQWVKVKTTTIDAREFHSAVTRFRYNSFRNRFIKLVREQGLITANQDTETYIGKLALAIEHAVLIQKTRTKKIIAENQKGVWSSFKATFFQMWEPISKIVLYISLFSLKKTEKQAKPESEDFFDLWLIDYEKGNKEKLAEWGAEFLDEAWKLSEQVRANRRDK